MGRLGAASAVAAALLLGGCTAVQTLAAIPAALVDAGVYLMRGVEESLPDPPQRALAAVQRGLDGVDLPLDLVVRVEDGYVLEFNGGELEGEMRLTRHTTHLTAIYVKVRRGVMRQDAVERMLVDQIRRARASIPADARFDPSGYNALFDRPDESSARLGWLREGSGRRLSAAREPGWMRLQLNSGNVAYVRDIRKGEESDGSG